jgi:hypothetical protein
MTKTEIAAVIGGIAVAGIAGYLLTRTSTAVSPSPVTSSYTVDLIATSTSMPVGQTQLFEVFVNDNGVPVNNALATLTDITSGVSSSTAVSNGVALFNVTISTAGTYTFQAQSEGVKSNTVSLVVSTAIKCPCGQVYSNGSCIPLQPSEVQFLVDSTFQALADVNMSFYVDVFIVDLLLGYFVEGVTMELGKTGVACPPSISKPSAKSLSGTISLQVQAVDNSDTPIGCTDIDLSLSSTSLSYTDQIGITWLLSFSVPSSVTTDSSGTANADVSWTLTRSWNGDAVQSGFPPNTETLSFGLLTVTGSLPSSTITGSIGLDISVTMCYYS